MNSTTPPLKATLEGREQRKSVKDLSESISSSKLKGTKRTMLYYSFTQV